MPPSGQPPSASLNARIRKSFAEADREFALDVDFTAPAGFTILFGPSGSGKTTLLNCVAGLTLPDDGRVTAGERILFDSDKAVGVPVAQRAVGYVLQDLALFPHLTVTQNVEYGLHRLARADRAQRAAAMLREFRIDHLRSRRPPQISGGERQRVALARALVTDPCVLLLDEPLAALDAPTKTKIIEDLRRWNEAHRIPILYVTHSREEVIALGERVLVIGQGRIVACGTPHEVLSAPQQESVAQLAGFENIFDATVESIHEDRGTMMCRITMCRITTSRIATTAAIGPQLLRAATGGVVLETPLICVDVGAQLLIGIRAGDILLAIAEPVGLSARNVIPGRVLSLERRDMLVAACVDCGVEMEVHMTPAARDALKLVTGHEVWLVIKTYSCHLMKN